LEERFIEQRRRTHEELFLEILRVILCLEFGIYGDRGQILLAADLSGAMTATIERLAEDGKGVEPIA
jgi:hypothetical protein